MAIHLPAFHTDDPFRFAAYTILAMVASSLKVSLPRITGTLSVLFLILLIGIIDLSLPETLVMGIAAVFVQSFWHAKKPPRPVHLAFNVASLVLAIAASHLAFTAGESVVPLPWRLAAAASVFFIGNTLTVATIIALTENKSVIKTWRTCYFWSFPYYLIGACIAGLFSYATHLVGWHISIFALPIVYVMYRSYRLYLDRLEQGRLHAEELGTAAKRLNAVLESTTDCVIAIDRDGRITYTNQRARSQLFGDSEGVNSLFWDRFPKLTAGAFGDQLRKAIAGKTPLDVEEFFPELSAWFEVHAYLSAEGAVLYLKEVTERRELGELLRQAQKMEAIGRLAGGVAHDFNNLLTIILGYGQLVADSLEKGSASESNMTEVLRAGERAAALTQRLLAFSRKQVLHPELLDLNAVVVGMEGLLRRLIGEDVRIVVKLDPHAGRVRADHNQIEQVVMNLAVNARDAMPNGGVINIATYLQPLEASGVGQYAVLSVSDTGHGMDPKTKAKIFEPFFTTKDQGKGTGLGLSMVYGIVQQSDGYISVESQPGRGSAFYVHLPSITDSKESDRDTKAPDFEADDELYSGSGKILLVEDEEAVRELALQMLTQAGYTVVSPDDGGEALRLSKLEIDSVDLLLTDVVMPGMSGPDLAAHLLKRKPELRVLYLSGYTDHPLIGGGALSERESLLQKPFTKNQLLSKVSKALSCELRPQA